MRTEFERRAKLKFCFVWGLLVPVEWAVACTQKTRREIICLQYFHNIFITNPKWQVVTGYYCWGKKVISVIGSNLN